ncbi:MULTISPECIES: cobalamin biosynthesis protein [unclassified Anabaena]|uniref:cobalamin biosynthesis protein n=1 Tax=unclassified Anabaena TaxID=2619674 RepID=UPI0039C63340
MQKPNLWVGIGCQQGSSRQLIATAIEEVFQANQLAESAIAGIATIDQKAREVGLIELCQWQNWPLKTFTAEMLSTVSVPNPSKIAEQAVGTPSVAEAAAMLAVLQINKQELKMSLSQTHFALPQPLLPKLLVTKQIFRLPGELKAVTLAVACSTKLF